jgi:hypothetical protein
MKELNADVRIDMFREAQERFLLAQFHIGIGRENSGSRPQRGPRLP